jgi:hypothetical protein
MCAHMVGACTCMKMLSDYQEVIETNYCVSWWCTTCLEVSERDDEEDGGVPSKMD